MTDPYLDPRSGILRNKPGIADQESFDQFEFKLGAGFACYAPLRERGICLRWTGA